jgi:HK97 family phage major capsid protein
MLRRTTPEIDGILTELLGEAFAEHEDSIFFAVSAASGGPTPFFATGGTTVHFVGESANGGTLTYSDILRTLRLAVAAKAKGPFVWFMSPRTFFDRVLPLEDTNGNNIVQKDGVAPIVYRLLGYPVFISPAIPENLSNGSGTNQSYVVLTNPKYLHLAQSGDIEVAVSTERYFEKNQTAIRVSQGLDFATAPAAGLVLLKGVA